MEWNGYHVGLKVGLLVDWLMGSSHNTHLLQQADFVVDNNGSLPDLQAQVDILRRTLAQHNIAV